MVGVGVVTLFTVFAASLKASVDDSVGAVVRRRPGHRRQRLRRRRAQPRAGRRRSASVPEVERTVGIGLRPRSSIGDRTRRRHRRRPADARRACSTSAPTRATWPASARRPDRPSAPSAPRTTAGRSATPSRSPSRRRRGRPDRRRHLRRTPTLVGDLIVPRDLWTAAPDPGPSTPSCWSAWPTASSVADGEAAVAGRGRRLRQARGPGPAGVHRHGHRRRRQDAHLIYVMLALAIVIALMGIANTLSLSIHERTRELGLLRAVGTTRRQMRSMVRWESVVVASFGTVGGIAASAASSAGAWSRPPTRTASSAPSRSRSARWWWSLVGRRPRRRPRRHPPRPAGREARRPRRHRHQLAPSTRRVVSSGARPSGRACRSSGPRLRRHQRP